MSTEISQTSDTKRVFYEQYRDANNKEPFGYVLRWTLDSCVEVDVFEIISSSWVIQATDDWNTGLSFESGDESMYDVGKVNLEPKTELDFINPTYHLYMKYDGTAHLWQSHYSGSGSAESILFTTDMLRYIATRSAQYVQERLNAKANTPMPEHMKVFPLNYNDPEIQVRPYEPVSV
jgi:hypothetical protein